ncbi:MAG TPA: type II secretion system protein [Ureibacillus sp.]|nr:type II secretion system protein [Ureibacillus sp.]
MKKKLQKLLKNQKGLTLVELLAVVVILGIIAAIAVPSIAGIIDNSKKDAHIANAEQMIGAARLAVAANDVKFDADNEVELTLQGLTQLGYLEEGLEDPDSGNPYTPADSKVVIKKTNGSGTTAGTIEYTVTLVGSERSITGQKQAGLIRDNVVENTPAP